MADTSSDGTLTARGGSHPLRPSSPSSRYQLPASTQYTQTQHDASRHIPTLHTPTSSSSSPTPSAAPETRSHPEAAEMPRQPTSSASSLTSNYSQSSYLQYQPRSPTSPQSTPMPSDAFYYSTSRRSSVSPAASRRPSARDLHARSASQTEEPSGSRRHAGSAAPLHLADAASGFFEPHYYPAGQSGAPMASSSAASPSPLMRRRPSLTTPRTHALELINASTSSRTRSATRLSDRNFQGRDVEIPDRDPSSSNTVPRGEVPVSPSVAPAALNSPVSSRLGYGIPEELQSPTKKKSNSLMALPEVPRRNSSVSHKGPSHERPMDSSNAPPITSPLRSPLPLTNRTPLPQPPMSVPRSSSDSSDYGSDADLTENLDIGGDAEHVASQEQSSSLEDRGLSQALQLGLGPPTLQRPQRHEAGSVSGVKSSAAAADHGAEMSTADDPRSLVLDSARSAPTEVSPDRDVPDRGPAPVPEETAQEEPVLTGPPLPMPIKYVEGTALSSETESSDASHYSSSPMPATGESITESEAALEAALLKAAEAEDPNRPRTLKEARELAKARAKARQMSEAGEMRQRSTDTKHTIATSVSRISEQDQARVTPTSITGSNLHTQSGDDADEAQAAPSTSADFPAADARTPDALADQIRTMDDLQAAVGDVLQSMSFGSDPPDAAQPMVGGRQHESVASELLPLKMSSRSGHPSREAMPSGVGNEDDEAAPRSSIGSSISSPHGYVTPAQQMMELPTFDSVGTIQAAADSNDQAVLSEEKQEPKEVLRTPSTPSVKRHPSDQEDVASTSGFATPMMPSSQPAPNELRQKASSYFPAASPASASNNASYPLAPLVQKRSSSQQINATTKLGIPGRTIPMPAAFNAAAIYSDRRKLPPWERARGYAQCVNDLSNMSSGLTLWMEAAQRRPVVSGPAMKRATELTGTQGGQVGLFARYPSELGANGPHPRDASGASARSDMTFPMRGDGGKARDVTDMPLDRTPADAMPGAVPSNIPYPALARNQPLMQDATSQDSNSAASAKTIWSQPSYVAPPSAYTSRADLRQQTSTTPSDYSSHSISSSGSSGRTGFFALGRRNSKRGPHPGPIGMLTASGSTASVTGPRLPRTGGGGTTAALGRVIGYPGSSAADTSPLSISSPTSAAPRMLDNALPISPPSSTYTGASQVPMYPGSAQGRTTEPGPMGPRTQALRSAVSTRSFSNGSISSQAQQQPTWQQAPPASQRRLEQVEPVEFTRALRSLRDVLPDADEEILRGYLRRAGGRDEVKAIGDYLSDQRAGRLRA
ncbi:hypothetical protein BCV69DRAFT_309581 [Microstroma glucosiphilum]|uniref:Uncharacterized protein n=1 Tax=Pseudomicrostroma glucosiphilum TaxID=1684307 RepID=A0A316UEP4_9BASI|nr:hypothetical protein BCV69DRAFT_309581 [Pseudomicrostroma glucosiphilum]PWN23706.1 hypothetical protein BCV69DRAFT_309581 [Pseudomicrostroma glucosiphilum]